MFDCMQSSMQPWNTGTALTQFHPYRGSSKNIGRKVKTMVAYKPAVCSSSLFIIHNLGFYFNFSPAYERRTKFFRGIDIENSYGLNGSNLCIIVNKSFPHINVPELRIKLYDFVFFASVNVNSSGVALVENAARTDIPHYRTSFIVNYGVGFRRGPDADFSLRVPGRTEPSLAVLPAEKFSFP